MNKIIVRILSFIPPLIAISSIFLFEKKDLFFVAFMFFFIGISIGQIVMDYYLKKRK
jgi:hypothetical protein